MNLAQAGKLFAKMFPTKERFAAFLRWQEIERDKVINNKIQQAKLDEQRRHIELMSTDLMDKDYDYFTEDCWEAVKDE